MCGHRVNAAHSQCGELALWNWKLDAVGDCCNGKGIQSAYFWYDSDILKCKRSLFAWYHTPLMLLASNFLERYVDANTVSDFTVPSQLSTLLLIFYGIKLILATGRLINVDKLTFNEAK